MTKPLNWFEITFTDIARARTFYEQIFGVSMQQHEMGETTLAVFPYDRASATGGCILQGPDYVPSRSAAVLYLNAGDSIDAVLEKVEASGGKILLPKTALPPGMGVFSHILDTEGNRVGLHAMN